MYEVVTFDCYGTLIDWERGIADAFWDEAARRGRSLDEAHVLRLYSEIEPRVQREGYRPYREVLAETARRVTARLGWADEPETRAARFLADSLPQWQPFADTNAALERLRAIGVRLAVLSNIDDNLFRETRRHFTVDFETVVTAAQVRSYKPAHAHFLEARRRLGEGVRWLHAAQSYFHDVVPAREMGVPQAWINRKHEAPTDGKAPTYELSDLTGLAELLSSAAVADR